MPSFRISYAYFKLDDRGRPKSKSSTQGTVQAPSDLAAMEMIRSKHPGYEIEFRKIEQK